MKFLLAAPRETAYAPIDLKSAKVVLVDGFANGTESPTVAGAESQGSTLIELTDGTMEKTVNVGDHLRFAGDTTKYVVTARTLNATGQDEVQSMAANTATGGTFTLTFTKPAKTVSATTSVTTAAISWDATAATIEAAIDTAFAGAVFDDITFTAGDITVAGGPANTTPVTFTYDGASVSKRNWPLMTVDGTALTGGSPGAVTTTTEGEIPGSTDDVTISPALVTALSGGEAITFQGKELEMKVGTGNVTYDETRTVEFLLDRGLISDVRLGDEEPMAVSFAFTWEFLESVPGATTPTVEDVLKKENAAANWVSTNPDACAPYCVDVQIRNLVSCGTDVPEIITLPQFYQQSLNHDAQAGSVTVDGLCNATVAVKTRTTLI